MPRLLAAGGLAAMAIAVFADSTDARSAFDRTWSPFVLVTGLLLVGQVAHRAGVFDRAASLLGRTGGSPVVLLVVLLALVAITTVVLNLDTAVAFLSPVLVLTARRRGTPEEPFLYGALFIDRKS